MISRALPGFPGWALSGLRSDPSSIWNGPEMTGFWHGFNAISKICARGLPIGFLTASGGPAGGVAAALATGLRGEIPEEVRQHMRDAGLAHLLAISGLHIWFGCGVCFHIRAGWTGHLARLGVALAAEEDRSNHSPGGSGGLYVAGWRDRAHPARLHHDRNCTAGDAAQPNGYIPAPDRRGGQPCPAAAP